MASIKVVNSTPSELRVYVQDASYGPDHRPADDWSEPALLTTLQSGAPAALVLSPIRRLLVETGSTSDVTITLDNQEIRNPIRVATQEKHGKGYSKPVHHLFLRPRHTGSVFGVAPQGSPDALVGLSAAKRLVLTLMPA